MVNIVTPKQHLLVPVLYGSKTYIQKVLGIQQSNLFLYHPMNEASGGVAIDASPESNDGAYTGVTLGQTGIGDGETCPLFDGLNDFNDIFTAGMQGDFDGTVGTMAVWAKANDWNASQGLMNIERDNNNEIKFYNNPSNVLQINYSAGATHTQVVKDVTGITDWMHIGITWDAVADEMKAYINGVQEGVTKTGLGVWVDWIVSSKCVVGSSTNVGSEAFSGYLAHAAMWDIALTPAEMLKVGTL